MKERFIEVYMQQFKRRLSGMDALPQLAILGILSGLITAVVMMLFQLTIEVILMAMLSHHDNPEKNIEAFETLPVISRLLFPIGGALAIGVLLYSMKIVNRKVGVAYVIERLGYHQGYITFKSALAQFFCGVMTITSGQSAGREGPAVHLGSACGSLLGQWMQLPNNSIRTLVGCGTAAAISASFNTPIAGVIFAMEVVMMEYTVTGFTPVILSSVTAGLLMHAFYGDVPIFIVPPFDMNYLSDIPLILVLAVMIGCASALFVHTTRFFMRYAKHPIFLRIIVGGVITGLVACIHPEIMGIGYDTVNLAIASELPVLVLLSIAVAKLLVTAIAVGLGMPSGLIGPTLFIGALFGGVCGAIGHIFWPELVSDNGFYAMVGMGAMMGSVLQAPLSALMALVELTQNPNIILPGMLAIVVSSMIASEGFKQKSIFLTILQAQGLKYQNDPILQALRRVSVGAIMERNLRRAPKVISYEEAKLLLKAEPLWIIIEQNDKPSFLMPAADLARKVLELKERFPEREERYVQNIDLLGIPAQRKDIQPVHFQATLQEALDRFTETGAEALYVERTTAPMIKSIIGVLTRSDIENYYRYKRS
ncbi:MAG: chloride channel protein [Hahellaceae bacterium]|nr:chloride channel protein [Hahellaceae bacterium]MCP5210769.1 chloride channel protein [Hahellaceae bacterium]